MNQTRHIPALLILIVLLAAPACGRKGAPQPPIKVQPQGSAGLTATQNGTNITLAWTLPQQNTDASDVVGFSRVELFRYTELLKPKKEGEEDEEEARYDVLDQVAQSFLAETPAEGMDLYGSGAFTGIDDGTGGKYGGGGQQSSGMLGGSTSGRSSGQSGERDGWADQQQSRPPRITPGFRDTRGKFISAGRFERNAELVHTLLGRELQGEETTQRLHFTDPVPEMDEELQERTRFHYAVRVQDTLGREGLFSEFLLVTPLTPPTAPSKLVATSTQTAIQLTWDGPPVNPWVRIAREAEEAAMAESGVGIEPGDAVDPDEAGKKAAGGVKGKMAAAGKGATAKSETAKEGEEEPLGAPEDTVVPGWIIQPPAFFGPGSPVLLTAFWPDPWPVGPRRPIPPYIAGYYVYRQLESDEGTPTVPSHGKPLVERLYENKLFTFGETYRFVVRTMMVTENGRVESESSVPVSVLAEDIYPPISPVNFTYVAAAGEVTLIWTANGEPDLLGYNVYRRQGTVDTVESEMVQINTEPLEEPRFKDATVLPGHWYTYQVDAVDQAEPANRSGQSEPLQVMAR